MKLWEKMCIRVSLQKRKKGKFKQVMMWVAQVYLILHTVGRKRKNDWFGFKKIARYIYRPEDIFFSTG